jgi:hypothetical protein
MAIVEDILKDKTAVMIAAGIGVAVLAPVLLPILAGAGRPLARAAIKTGIIMFEKGREAVAEVGEVFDDLVAEARAEIHQNHAAQDAASSATAGVAAVGAAVAASSAAPASPPADAHE